jgi:hypothetical protein
VEITMRPTKAYLTAGKTFWYVALPSNNYLHVDGIVRHGCQNTENAQMSGHFPTRAAARQAIRLHKTLKTTRSAEVFAHDGYGGIKFIIEGDDGFKMSGSEPYDGDGRCFSEALIGVGMVLAKFGVKDYKFHWRKPV